MLWLLPAHDIESHRTPASAVNHRFRRCLPGAASRLRDRSRRRQIGGRYCVSICHRGFRNPASRWTGKRLERRVRLHPARLRLDGHGTTLFPRSHCAFRCCYRHRNGVRETRFRRGRRCHSPRRVSGWGWAEVADQWTTTVDRAKLSSSCQVTSSPGCPNKVSVVTRMRTPSGSPIKRYSWPAPRVRNGRVN